MHSTRQTIKREVAIQLLDKIVDEIQDALRDRVVCREDEVLKAQRVESYARALEAVSIASGVQKD